MTVLTCPRRSKKMTSKTIPSWEISLRLLVRHWYELRAQYARRSFDFPVVSTQPHLEVANTFAIGVNRGNPDFYKEPRFEIVDNVTHVRGGHTWTFGGNFNWVRTTESFPLFYPSRQRLHR